MDRVRGTPSTRFRSQLKHGSRRGLPRLRGIIPPDSRPEKALEMWAVDSHPSFLVANAQQYIIFKLASKLLRVLVLSVPRHR